MNTEELLHHMRGTKRLCACGYPLIPCIVDGKQIGFTHEDDGEIAEHHDAYFSNTQWLEKVNKEGLGL